MYYFVGVSLGFYILIFKIKKVEHRVTYLNVGDSLRVWGKILLTERYVLFHVYSVGGRHDLEGTEGRTIIKFWSEITKKIKELQVCIRKNEV